MWKTRHSALSILSSAIGRPLSGQICTRSSRPFKLTNLHRISRVPDSNGAHSMLRQICQPESVSSLQYPYAIDRSNTFNSCRSHKIPLLLFRFTYRGSILSLTATVRVGSQRDVKIPVGYNGRVFIQVPIYETDEHRAELRHKTCQPRTAAS